MTANDTGSYSLFVSNQAGVAVSPEALLTIGPVVGFGNNTFNQCLPPAGLSNVVSLAVGYGGFAVKADGSVANWGTGAQTIPADFTNVVALAVIPGGASQSTDSLLALRADGTVSGIGLTTPAAMTNIVAIDCNSVYPYGVRSDGTLVTAGLVPTGLNRVVAVSASDTQGMALRSDGTIVVWKMGSPYTATNVPSGLSNVVSIASGFGVCLVAKSDGSMVSWGPCATNPPPSLTNVISVAASKVFSGTSNSTVCAAVRADGSVAFWGGSLRTPTNIVVPSSITNAVAAAVGWYDGLGLVNDGSPQLLRSPVGGAAYSGRDFSLTCKAVGAPVITYQWLRDGNVLADATNATLTVTNIQQADAGNYQVVVGNPLGTVTSMAAPVKVTDSRPWLAQQPVSVTAYPGSRVELGGMPVNGSGPLTYTWRVQQAGNTFNITTTNSSLVFDPVRLKDAASYTLFVSNQFGSTFSQGVILTVPSILAWGNNLYGQTNVPTNLTDAIAICAGNFYNSIALRANGTAQQWGFSGTNTPPFVNLCEVAVASRYNGFLGLTTAGKVVGWGGLSTSVLNMVAGLSNIVAIESDESGSAFLRPNGTFVRIDTIGNVVNMSALVDTNIVAISRWNGDSGFMALHTDGTLFVGGTFPPADATNVVSMAGAYYGSVVLKRDGTVESWGTFTNAPMSNVLAVTSTASAVNFAVHADGSVTNWGMPTRAAATNQPSFLAQPWALEGGYDSVVALFTTNDWPAVPLYTALDTTALVVSSRSSPQWFGQTNVTHDGLHAARSAALGSRTSSSMRMLATNGTIKVSFWWKVSSATNHGVLTFSIGGVPQASISGEVDWQQVTFDVPPGPQMLVWTYSKNSADTSGMDAGFVDQLTFMPIAPTITLSPVSQTIIGGPTAVFTAAATGTAPLSYRWFNVTNSTAIASAPGIFRVAPTYRSSSGTFYLVVTNACGSDRSTNFSLTVHVPQRIALPVLQPDGTFLLTSQDADQMTLPDGTDLSGFQAQYSSNLIDWLPLTTALTVSNGLIQVNDVDSTNAPQRFYRIIERW